MWEISQLLIKYTSKNHASFNLFHKVARYWVAWNYRLFLPGILCKKLKTFSKGWAPIK